MPRPRRTMGLEGGHRPMSKTELEPCFNCYGPSHLVGRLLATIEKRDKLLQRIKEDSDRSAWVDQPRENLRRIRRRIRNAR